MRIFCKGFCLLVVDGKLDLKSVFFYFMVGLMSLVIGILCYFVDKVGIVGSFKVVVVLGFVGWLGYLGKIIIFWEVR